MYKYDIYWEKERLTNIMQVKKRVGKTIETISVFYKQQPTYNPQMVKYEGPKRFNKVRNGKIGSLIEVSKSKKVKPYVDTGYRYPTQVWKFKRDTLISTSSHAKRIRAGMTSESQHDYKRKRREKG